ncbi:hypothetical protein ACSBR1_021078 [Camellia fascicularis]
MAQTSQVKGSVDMSPDCIGDDDILEVEQRRKEALSRTGEESQSALESSLQDVVSRYSFMDLWPCSSKDLDHLAWQEVLIKLPFFLVQSIKLALSTLPLSTLILVVFK